MCFGAGLLVCRMCGKQWCVARESLKHPVYCVDGCRAKLDPVPDAGCSQAYIRANVFYYKARDCCVVKPCEDA